MICIETCTIVHSVYNCTQCCVHAKWQITVFWALDRDKLWAKLLYSMKKNILNPNYILNQFMLFYKDKNIEHKNET